LSPDTSRLRSPSCAITNASSYLLVAWEDLDAPAIAAVLGCSRNAARIRLHRARRRFARALTEVDAEVKRESRGAHLVSAGLTSALTLEDRS
jgi:hypothetical protein